jgi:hypothetical protein
MFRRTAPWIPLLLTAAACGGVVEPEAIEPVAQDSQALCAQPNYLQNPSFTTVGPNGPNTTVTLAAPGGGGNSAAQGWTVFLNTPGTVRTDLVTSTRERVGNMLHVYTTTGPRNGIVQVFGAFNSGPTKVISGAWVYVVRGQVGIGTGNGGQTGIDAVSTTIGQWEYVAADNGSIPANEFIVYGTATGVNEFYVDFAQVQLSPNLLQNPTFATVGPNGPVTSTTTLVPGGAGNSAAANWTLFTNTPGYIGTDLQPSTLPGMVRMIHVRTHGPGNGLVQVMPGAASCTPNGPQHTLATAWVYVNVGQVGIGTGDGGNTQIDKVSTTTGQWEILEAPNGVSPANTFIVYATTSYGADFYVGFARVNETP